MFSPFFQSINFAHRIGLLQQFLIAAGLTIAISMALLAYFMSERIGSSLMQSAAEEAALLVDAFVGPTVQELDTSNVLSPESAKKLDDIVKGQLGKRIRTIKIWLRDGTLAYATNKELVGKKFPSEYLEAAFSGKISGTFDDLDDDEDHYERSLNTPLIEIYAPLRRIGTQDIIAVGQLYNSGERLAEELRSIRFAAAGIVAAVTIPMMALLFLMVRQANRVVIRHRTLLTRKIAETEALAIQNDRLRQQAEDAKIESARSNEILLEQIGQDLHDGPIQLLSLLMLKVTDTVEADANEVIDNDRPTGHRPGSGVHQLASTILTELREISEGLVLPQLEGLTLADAVLLAVRTHEHVTGTAVTCEIESPVKEVPMPVRVCIYRVVQEGLNNAFAHAGGRDQRIQISTDNQHIIVTVTDGGAECNGQQPARSRTGLGLSGLRRRVVALRGSFEVALIPGRGTQIVAKLPIGAPRDQI
ncbi:sensor histidine kinase [Bradyrhizobium sp. SYSU BS000235]|uniref:sensor histidine kinase n=1 Tax=Bradyrhizobium sp. SYSU BS000235 TaxID=3411332 RepID=UPI003C7850CB